MRRVFLILRMLWISEAPWRDTLIFAWYIACLPRDQFEQMYVRELRATANAVEHEALCDGTCAFCDPKHPKNAEAVKAMDDLFGGGPR